MSTAGAVAQIIDHRETVARWQWTGLIVVLLALQVLLGFVAVFLATSDPSWAVVPHYHERAMNWDAVIQARQASQALGWTSNVSVSDGADVYGKRRLIVDLRDSQNAPVVDAKLQISLWHHARPLETQDLSLAPDLSRPGRYYAEALVRRSGLWEVELRADRRGEHFQSTTRETWHVR